MKIVWQCGHCGVVYNTKSEANECHDGYAEESRRCKKCGNLYHHTIRKCTCEQG